MATHQAVFRFHSTDEGRGRESTVTYCVDCDQWVTDADNPKISVEVRTTAVRWSEIRSHEDIMRLTRSRELVFSGYLPLLASHDSLLVALILEAHTRLTTKDLKQDRLVAGV